MNNLPQKIKLTIHGEEIDFSLTDKREIKYYGKTETSNESLWRVDNLEDNEVFYQTEWGWGVFVKIEDRELSFNERYKLCKKKTNENPLKYSDENGNYPEHIQKPILKWMESENIPTKLITITYNNETIENYEY